MDVRWRTMAAVPPRLTVLSELPEASFEALVTDGVVATLARLGAAVSMATLDLGQARERAVRRLSAAGIPLIAWLVVDEADGYWAHARNAAVVRRRFDEVRAFEERVGIRFSAFALDIEPRLGDDDVLPTAGVRVVGRLFRRVLTPDELARCEAEWAATCAAIRAEGRPLLAYLPPPMLDERRSTLLRRTLGLTRPTVDVEIPMLYSSFLRPMGAGVVASYARGAAAVAVGSTGGGVTAGGLDQVRPLSWAELARDLRLVADVPDVHLFSLEGAIAQGQLARLVDFDWTEPPPRVLSRGFVDTARGIGRGLQKFIG